MYSPTTFCPFSSRFSVVMAYSSTVGFLAEKQICASLLNNLSNIQSLRTSPSVCPSIQRTRCSEKPYPPCLMYQSLKYVATITAASSPTSKGNNWPTWNPQLFRWSGTVVFFTSQQLLLLKENLQKAYMISNPHHHPQKMKSQTGSIITKTNGKQPFHQGRKVQRIGRFHQNEKLRFLCMITDLLFPLVFHW